MLLSAGQDAQGNMLRARRLHAERAIRVGSASSACGRAGRPLLPMGPGAGRQLEPCFGSWEGMGRTSKGGRSFFCGPGVGEVCETPRNSTARSDPGPPGSRVCALDCCTGQPPTRGQRQATVVGGGWGPQCPGMISREQEALQPWCGVPGQGTCSAAAWWLRWPGRCLPALNANCLLCQWVSRKKLRGLPLPPGSERVGAGQPTAVLAL